MSSLTQRYIVQENDVQLLPIGSCGYCTHFASDGTLSMCNKLMFPLATRSIASILALVKMAENCPEYEPYGGTTS